MRYVTSCGQFLGIDNLSSVDSFVAFQHGLLHDAERTSVKTDVMSLAGR